MSIDMDEELTTRTHLKAAQSTVGESWITVEIQTMGETRKDALGYSMCILGTQGLAFFPGNAV